MTETPLDLLGHARTVLLTTFRKDGTPVPTPVWVVRSGAELQVWTGATAGKVKRIRNSGRVTLAPCSMRGEPRGVTVPATARIMTDAETDGLLPAIAAKYGLLGRLAMWSSAIGNRLQKRPDRAGIAITLD